MKLAVSIYPVALANADYSISVDYYGRALSRSGGDHSFRKAVNLSRL
jgi:hypothetical protein